MNKEIKLLNKYTLILILATIKSLFMSKLIPTKFSYYKRNEERIDSNEWILIVQDNSEYGQAFSTIKFSNDLYIGSTYGTKILYTVKCTRKEAIKILGSKNFKRAIKITKRTLQKQ